MFSVCPKMENENDPFEPRNYATPQEVGMLLEYLAIIVLALIACCFFVVEIFR